MTCPVQFGNRVKLFGRIPELLGRLGPELDDPLLNPNALVSMILRDAMMVSISHNWKRSTTSAHVSWKRFSLSNLLKTVDLISTN